MGSETGEFPTANRPHIWLRAETKAGEERTALTPRYARHLLDSGFDVTVERSKQRAISISDYEAAGCTVAKAHAWKHDAPRDAWVLGLKELESGDSPLVHRHIHFAHVYKQQRGWETTLRRFAEGGGVLYDLEFLVDAAGRRVAAFGRWAGFAGASLALLAWAGQQQGQRPALGSVTSRASRSAVVTEVRRALEITAATPRVMVIGALGRSGRGAVELAKSAGADVLEWDLEETRAGGPFAEILDADVFLNCVFVQAAVPPFLTRSMLDSAQRRLSVICDVSCDPFGVYNPLPIYETCTSFAEPVIRLCDDSPPLDLIAIDHLPSLLPVESSEDFCAQLCPYLLQLRQVDEGVWKRAREVFQQKTDLARQGA